MKMPTILLYLTMLVSPSVSVFLNADAARAQTRLKEKIAAVADALQKEAATRNLDGPEDHTLNLAASELSARERLLEEAKCQEAKNKFQGSMMKNLGLGFNPSMLGMPGMPNLFSSPDMLSHRIMAARESGSGVTDVSKEVCTEKECSKSNAAVEFLGSDALNQMLGVTDSCISNQISEIYNKTIELNNKVVPLTDKIAPDVYQLVDELKNKTTRLPNMLGNLILQGKSLNLRNILQESEVTKTVNAALKRGLGQKLLQVTAEAMPAVRGLSDALASMMVEMHSTGESMGQDKYNQKVVTPAVHEAARATTSSATHSQGIGQTLADATINFLQQNLGDADSSALAHGLKEFLKGRPKDGLTSMTETRKMTDGGLVQHEATCDGSQCVQKLTQYA